MRIAIIGGSGFIGHHLKSALESRGDRVLTVSLSDATSNPTPLSDYDAVVNLAGEPLAQRWSDDVKSKIESSRIEGTRKLVDALATLQPRPRAFVCASAVGYYGTSNEATFTEESAPGDDFLARVCLGWEREAQRASEMGMREARVRTGIVLGNDGGALKQMLGPFKMGVGGVIGDGKQWISWVHVDDIVGVYMMAIDGASGPLNATAPHAVTNAEFTHALGGALQRPTALPTPTFALKMMLGEGAVLLTHGQHVIPERTLADGYAFKHPRIEEALASLLG